MERCEGLGLTSLTVARHRSIPVAAYWMSLMWGKIHLLHSRDCVKRATADLISEMIFLLYFSSRPRSRANSVESFVSAVEEPDDLIKFEDDSVSPSHFVITSPSLVYKYSQHLGQLECLNWNSPLMIPPEQRHFSITNNLKVREKCIISVFRGV